MNLQGSVSRRRMKFIWRKLTVVIVSASDECTGNCPTNKLQLLDNSQGLRYPQCALFNVLTKLIVVEREKNHTVISTELLRKILRAVNDVCI